MSAAKPRKRPSMPRGNEARTRRPTRPIPGERRALTHAGGPTRVKGDEARGALLARAFENLEARDPDDLTHGFHAYPARMHPAVAKNVIAELTTEKSIVLDPFCGGGTVLVESLVAGRRTAGADLNPLALRIAEVRTDRRDARSRAQFLEHLAGVATRSEARVRARVPVRAPIPRHEVRWYDGHVLLELGGLREEIEAIDDERDRRALEVLLSAIVVKFSRQRADTAESSAEKRIRKGLVTEFFQRKGQELAQRWAAFEAALPKSAKPPKLFETDVRDLKRALDPRVRPDLILTSPPYGGTYDYASHHARRYPWLGLDAKSFERREIGARRKLEGDEAIARWETEVRAMLRSLASVLAPKGTIVLLVGDAQLSGQRIYADVQLARLAGSAGLEVVASASQTRPDFTGRRPRLEHLVMLAAAR